MRRMAYFWMAGMFVFLFFFWACESKDRGDIQKKQIADRIIQNFEDAVLELDNVDYKTIFRNGSDIVFFAYRNNNLVYWSDNAVSFNNLDIISLDQWEQLHLDNADCWCRMKVVGHHSVLALIPIRWHRHCSDNDIDASFTYRFFTLNDKSATYKFYHRLIFVGWCIIIAIIVWGLFLLWRRKRINNIKWLGKFVYVFVFLFFLSLQSLLYWSAHRASNVYIEKEKERMREVTKHVRYTLQNLYPWVVSLSSEQGYGMSIDLRDLAHICGHDIHVYDLNGSLIGSSAMQLASCGFFSTYLHPSVLDTAVSAFIGEEQVCGKRCYASYAEFLNGGYAHIGYIAIPFFISESQMYETAYAFVKSIFPVFVVTWLIIFVIISLLLRYLLHHLRKLTLAMEGFELGKGSAQITYLGKDEVGALVSSYNRIVEIVGEASRRLMQMEREEAWRTMARQIAHEINNPLTPMKLVIQHLQRIRKQEKDNSRFDTYFDKATSMLIDQIESLSRIAISFSHFANVPTIHIDKVDIAKKLSSSIRLFANNELGIPIRYVGADSGVYAIADKELIGQVFNNVLKNAIQATADTPDGDVIVMLKLRAETGFPHEIANLTDYVEISISDNGQGIKEEHRDKIFTPNFTTKSNGTGLGLAISKNILVSCGGKITFVSSSRGTTFFIYLVRREPSP